MGLKRTYLCIPRDATFPTLPFSETFTEYAHAYYLAASRLWDQVGRSRDVPRPDSLVYPILFLVHQYLELELKQVIVLSHSIGAMTGDVLPGKPPEIHNLAYLLKLVDENLAKLGDVLPQLPLSEETRDLIEDMNRFGILGEALRYPYHKVKAKNLRNTLGSSLPDAVVADVPAVMKLVEKAWHEFNGIIGELVAIEDNLFNSIRDL